jgi:hypothetical protein
VAPPRGDETPPVKPVRKATAARTPRKAPVQPAAPIRTTAPKPAEKQTEPTPPAEQTALTPVAEQTDLNPATEQTDLKAATEQTDPWAKLIEDPGHAPELLALAAVQTLGPRAAEWVARTRASYPAADNAALARLATRQFTRFGGLGSFFGAVAGSYAPVALLGSAAITQAEISLHLAAAYGLEPTDPQRAADLLVIARVHPTLADAEAAIAAARRPSYDEAGLSDAVWRLGRMIATQSGGWALVRLVNRLFPGIGVLAAVLAGTASAQSAAARANSYYRMVTD